MSIKGAGVEKSVLYDRNGGWASFLCLFLILGMIFCAPATAAEKYPSSRGTAVNDFANVIDPAKTAKIESLANAVLQKTGTAIVVVTLPELGPAEEINLYTNGLYKAWGIGKKGEDKGVLILLAVKERKIRIETGYGVEGILTDGRVGEILDKFVIPHFKAGDFGKGLYNAVFACGVFIADAAGVKLSETNAYPYRTKSEPKNKGFNLIGLILVLIAAAVLLGTRQGRQILPWILLLLVSGSGRGSGGGGSFGGGFGGFGGGMSGGGGADRDF